MKGKVMGGWKTWAGVGLTMLSGGVGAIVPAISDPGTAQTIVTIMQTVGVGLGMLGIGHKIEKNAPGKL